MLPVAYAALLFSVGDLALVAPVQCSHLLLIAYDPEYTAAGHHAHTASTDDIGQHWAGHLHDVPHKRGDQNLREEVSRVQGGYVSTHSTVRGHRIGVRVIKEEDLQVKYRVRK